MTFTIDKNLAIYSVDLNVENLGGMTTYYRDNIGLSVLEESENYVSLGIQADQKVLVNLIKTDSKNSQTKKAGLFHTAFLVPERRDLGNILFALLQKEVAIEGASDHGYSEALYLTDPEGNGIEIYRDKPREEWDIQSDGTIKGVTEQMDAEGVLASRDDQFVNLFPEGTSIGHVHLSAADLSKSQHFYIDVLGMSLKYEFGPQARFIAAGGYHHHIGLNTWMGSNIPVREKDDLGLTRFTLNVTSREQLNALKENILANEVTVEDESETFLTVTDPNGIYVTITTAD